MKLWEHVLKITLNSDKKKILQKRRRGRNRRRKRKGRGKEEEEEEIKTVS